MPKTLFVIGAGASSEFGLPLGQALANSIRGRLQEELRHGAAASRPILDGGMSSGLTGDWAVAARELAGGLVSARSIDRLIEARSDRPLVVALAKFAIAQTIAEGERNSILSPSIDRDWDKTHEAMTAAAQSYLGILFSQLQEGVKPKNSDEIFSDISFVTFNYDRIIERYLKLAFEHVIGLSDSEAIERVKRVSIEHVYGGLGDCIECEDSKVEFGVEDERVRDTVGSFKTFTDGIEMGQLDRIGDLVRESDKIVFLGFSFDPINLDYLIRGGLSPHQKICGTTLGMGENELVTVYQSLGIRTDQIYFAQQKCSDLLRSDLFRGFFTRP